LENQYNLNILKIIIKADDFISSPANGTSDNTNAWERINTFSINKELPIGVGVIGSCVQSAFDNNDHQILNTIKPAIASGHIELFNHGCLSLRARQT
jgi:hypothetical protein